MKHALLALALFCATEAFAGAVYINSNGTQSINGALTRSVSGSGLTSGAVTVAGFFRFDRVENYHTLFGLPGTSDWQVSIQADEDLHLWMGFDAIAVGPTWVVDTWYFVALTSNGTTVTLYIGPVGGSLSSGSSSVVSNTFSDIVIGAFPDFGDAEAFVGKVTGVRVWSRALTLAELEDEATQLAAMDTTNLWAEWILPDATAGYLVDSSGNSRDLTEGFIAPTTYSTGPFDEPPPPDPTPTYVGAGAAFANALGGVVSLPASLADNDILLLACETVSQTITITDSGGGSWTEAPDSPQTQGTSGGTASARLTVYWSRFNGTQGNITVSDSGDHQLCRISAFRGVRTDADPPFNVTCGGIEGADTSLSVCGDTTTVDDTLIVGIVALSDDTGGFGATWTNANLTEIAERWSSSTTAGNDGRLGLFTGKLPTAGVYTTTSNTLTASLAKAFITIALQPPDSSPPPSGCTSFIPLLGAGCQ